MHVSTTSQLESDLDLALDEGADAEHLRAEVLRLQDQCLGLQEQVDAADGAADLVSAVAVKCERLEDEVAAQSAAIAKLEEMLEVSDEVEELQVNLFWRSPYSGERKPLFWGEARAFCTQPAGCDV